MKRLWVAVLASCAMFMAFVGGALADDDDVVFVSQPVLVEQVGQL